MIDPGNNEWPDGIASAISWSYFAKPQRGQAGPVVGDHIGEAVQVHVLQVTVQMGNRSGVRSEGERRYINVHYVERVAADYGNGDHATRARVDAVGVAVGFDVNDD